MAAPMRTPSPASSPTASSSSPQPTPPARPARYKLPRGGKRSIETALAVDGNLDEDTLDEFLDKVLIPSEKGSR
ncbi:hypothetical protein [Microbispora rosea]|uniref:hypothetical protein n=1 Tax=Microbispora rosea TaxID=58117 RepID=UPI00117E480C|nr:hypothetical protein [Microbispora rosea]GIH47857.1 hypothetical protein Mro03_30360 [Microbispora rosea subsp. rosea]